VCCSGIKVAYSQDSQKCPAARTIGRKPHCSPVSRRTRARPILTQSRRSRTVPTLTEDRPQPPSRASSIADEYRKRASHCLEIARHISLVRDRASLIEMAQHWLDLAQRAEAEGQTPERTDGQDAWRGFASGAHRSPRQSCGRSGGFALILESWFAASSAVS